MFSEKWYACIFMFICVWVSTRVSCVWDLNSDP